MAVTIGFLTFGFARLWHVLNMRSADSPLLRNEVTTNPFAWLAVALGIGLLIAATYVPVLSEVLSVEPPGGDGWLLLLAASLVPLVVVQLSKLAGLRWESSRGPA